MFRLVDTVMVVWRISYRAVEKGPWIETESGGPDAPSAWRIWDMWKRVHHIEWVAVQVYEVSITAQLVEKQQQGRKEGI